MCGCAVWLCVGSMDRDTCKVITRLMLGMVDRLLAFYSLFEPGSFVRLTQSPVNRSDTSVEVLPWRGTGA